jgi:hypothetical protein
VLTLKISHCPDGKIADVLARTHACTTANHALVDYRGCVLHRTFESSHHPDGKIANVLALTHACITAANAPVDYRMYVSQRPSKVPIAPMGKCLVDRSISILILF